MPERCWASPDWSARAVPSWWRRSSAYGARDRGHLWLDGTLIHIRSPFDAVRHGLALVPDDRKGKGLVTNASVAFNLGLTSHNHFSSAARLARARRGAQSRSAHKHCPAWTSRSATLSGGNQQKVVLGKWLLAGARVYLFDEPTRGIDVGAKAEIHHLIGRLARERRRCGGSLVRD